MSVKIIMYLADTIFMGVGIIFFAASIGMKYQMQKRTKRCKMLTQGKVVEMKRESSSTYTDGPPTFSWYPVYEYMAKGRTIKKMSRIGQAKEIFYAGQVVNLYYNPQNINEFYVPEEKTEKVMTIFQAVGLLLLVLGVILLFVFKQMK